MMEPALVSPWGPAPGWESKGEVWILPLSCWYTQKRWYIWCNPTLWQSLRAWIGINLSHRSQFLKDITAHKQALETRKAKTDISEIMMTWLDCLSARRASTKKCPSWKDETCYRLRLPSHNAFSQRSQDEASSYPFFSKKRWVSLWMRDAASMPLTECPPGELTGMGDDRGGEFFPAKR